MKLEKSYNVNIKMSVIPFTAAIMKGKIHTLDLFDLSIDPTCINLPKDFGNKLKIPNARYCAMRMTIIDSDVYKFLVDENIFPEKFICHEQALKRMLGYFFHYNEKNKCQRRFQEHRLHAHY